MNKTRYAFLVALTTALTVPVTVIAEEQSPIIVTATRTAQTVDETLASVTVISKEQIEQQQPDDLLDLLTSIRGIDIANSGGMGKTTDIYVRGTSSKHVLFMIDSVKVGSATLGSVSFQHIPVSQIERIEIVRGPRASLYGSEAVGGVIQIFTKKGTAKEQASIELSHGTYTTNKIAAGFSTKAANTTFAFNASHFSTAGFDAKKDTETDNDGYSNTSATFNVNHAISDTSALNLNLMRASGTNNFDGFYNNSSFVQQTTGLNYSFAALSNWNIKFNLAQSKDETDNFTDSTFKTRFNTVRDIYNWQNDITIGTEHLLTFGVDYQNDTVDSTTAYDKTSRDNTAGYVQHQWTGEKNDIQIGLRNDDNQTFGNHTTGNISWGYNFSKETRMIASYGTAFRAPTFNELYYPDTGFGGGDPTLKPESSSSTEIEIRKKHSWGNTSVSAYNTQIDNLISGWPPANVNKAEINGVEISLDTKLAGWDTRVELSLLDPKDRETGYILQRRAKEMLRIDMDKKSGQWSTGISFIGQGKRYDSTDNTNKLDGYGIINLRASYAVSDKLSVKWKIENLLDKEYETATDYNNPGINGYLSLAYQGF